MGFNMMVEISNNIICIIDTFHKFLCRLGIKWRWLCACYMCYITIWIYFEYIKYISIPFHQYANKSESPDTGIRSPNSPMNETCGLASYLVCRYVNLNVQEFANLYSLCNVFWCVLICRLGLFLSLTWAASRWRVQRWRRWRRNQTRPKVTAPQRWWALKMYAACWWGLMCEWLGLQMITGWLLLRICGKKMEASGIPGGG